VLRLLFLHLPVSFLTSCLRFSYLLLLFVYPVCFLRCSDSYTTRREEQQGASAVHICPKALLHTSLSVMILYCSFSPLLQTALHRVLGLHSRRGMGIFLFTTASRTALGPTQPPIQWVPGALSLGVKRPGREADHSPHYFFNTTSSR
jgi:hypothetical protein